MNNPNRPIPKGVWLCRNDTIITITNGQGSNGMSYGYGGNAIKDGKWIEEWDLMIPLNKRKGPTPNG